MAAFVAADGRKHFCRPARSHRRHQRFPFILRDLDWLLAVTAERAHQALRDHTDQRHLEQIGWHAKLQKARHGGGSVVGVHRRQHQMAGEGRLHGGVRRLLVADLSHHDDVGVLPKQRTHAGSEIETDLMLHVHLIEVRVHQLDGIFDGANVDLGFGKTLQGRVERGGLARTRGTRDHDHAVGLLHHALPLLHFLGRETQVRQGPHQHFRVENAHDELFAECRRHGG